MLMLTLLLLMTTHWHIASRPRGCGLHYICSLRYVSVVSSLCNHCHVTVSKVGALQLSDHQPDVLHTKAEKFDSCAAFDWVGGWSWFGAYFWDGHVFDWRRTLGYISFCLGIGIYSLSLEAGRSCGHSSVFLCGSLASRHPAGSTPTSLGLKVNHQLSTRSETRYDKIIIVSPTM